MVPAISTHVFLPHRLDTALLDALRLSGARSIELFAARYHFDYTDRGHLRELAAWFQGTGTAATMHAPLSTDEHFSRHAGPTLNLIDPAKGRRIAAMDEIKRALEAAEQIAIASCVLHLGLGSREDRWSEYTLEYALTALEHLNAFAGPLGVRLLLENLRNEVTTPERLMQILRVGHLDRCGICLDVGHAHLGDYGITSAFEILGPRIAELHLHDNHGADGKGDEHLWPATHLAGEDGRAQASGTIPWQEVYALAATLPAEVLGTLEIIDTQADSPATVPRLAGQVFAHGRRLMEDTHR